MLRLEGGLFIDPSLIDHAKPARTEYGEAVGPPRMDVSWWCDISDDGSHKILSTDSFAGTPDDFEKALARG